MNPNVIDMYHGNNRETVPDMIALKASGIYGIIHKVGQGLDMTDKLYKPRRDAAVKAGMLWGGYYFLTSADPIEQAKRFVDLAAPDANTLLACDYEKSSATASLQQCKSFMQYVDENAPDTVTCVLYSGDLIRETLRQHAGGHQNNAMIGCEMFFAQHRLWLAEYGPHPNIPWPWSDKAISQMWQQPFLWQYSEKGRVNPIIGASDLNYYAGNFEALKANWPSLSTPTPNPAAPTV